VSEEATGSGDEKAAEGGAASDSGGTAAAPPSPKKKAARRKKLANSAAKRKGRKGPKAGRGARAASRKSPGHARNARSPALRRPADGRNSAKLERVRWCIEEMTGARWRPGASHLEGMQKFNVSRKTIEDDAAEASRWIRELVMKEEDLKDLCTAALHHAMKMAAGAKDASRGSEALTKAVGVMAGIHGLEAAKKLDLGVQSNLASILNLGLGAAPKEPDPQ
jgi:hypothetical protein